MSDFRMAIKEVILQRVDEEKAGFAGTYVSQVFKKRKDKSEEIVGADKREFKFEVSPETQEFFKFLEQTLFGVLDVGEKKNAEQKLEATSEDGDPS